MENKNVTALMNEFINIDNLIEEAKKIKNYEKCAQLRNKRLELQKEVFNNIVLPYIPISVEYNLKK